MVNIAIAGGTGQVGREVTDALAATNKHTIMILTRKATLPPAITLLPGVSYLTVDYTSIASLTTALQGVHTVLSFTQPLSDPDSVAQKNLIDAAIKAGVQRFAPSQWGSASTEGMPWWRAKDAVVRHLEQANTPARVLEYTLFQPGLFLEYLGAPHQTATHLRPLNTPIDMANRRAVVVAGCDAVLGLTSVRDLAGAVVGAVEMAGVWPVVGGVRGSRVTVGEVVAIGERVRGGAPFAITSVSLSDLEKGILKSPWMLEASHPSVDEAEAQAMRKAVMIGMLVAGAKGAWDVGDQFNQLLPDAEFVGVEEYLRGVWAGRE